MSNLPSTEELQRLLDKATPGPWVTVGECYTDNDGNERYSPESISSRADGIGRDVMWNTDGAVSWCSNPHDPQLAAHAPELAAEVIQLRAALEQLQKDMRHQPESYVANEVANTIRTILEGEQAMEQNQVAVATYNLPKPDRAGHDGIVEWDVPTSNHAPASPTGIAWTAPGGTIMLQRIEPGDLTPKEAGRLAVTLLAAQKYSETGRIQ